VWVGVEGDDRTVLVDLDAGETIGEHSTPGGPHNVTVAPDGTAAAALYATTDVAMIAEGDVEIVSLGGRPHDVKATDEWFIVANEAGRRLDFVSLDGEPGPSVELRSEPHDLAIDPDGERAWVTMNRADELAVVDLDAAEVDRYVATGHAPHDLLFASDGRLWVTDWTGRLLVLDGGEVIETRELGVEAHHLAFTPDGAEAWITDHATNELFVLNADTAEVLEAIDLPGAPHHVTITPDGVLAAVADHTDGQLLVYDTATREQVDAVNVGPGPHGVWAAPAAP
jgi:DNA-binding beta-propeller fold protein YncE